MQVDKAVSHQFSLCLPCNLHEPLSTCGMLSQHLDGACLGFKFCCTQCIPPEWHKTQSFWTVSVFLCWNTVGAGPWLCLVHLDYVRHTPSISTGNCHELCKTWCIFACFCFWIGTHHGHHHIKIFEMLAAAAAANLLDSVYTNSLATECQTSWC